MKFRLVSMFHQRQTVTIDDALASEASEVQIEVELLCGCDCKNEKSTYCEHGINECGVCKCDLGWSGMACLVSSYFSVSSGHFLLNLDRAD